MASGDGSKENVDKAGDDRSLSEGGTPSAMPLSFVGVLVGDIRVGNLGSDMVFLRMTVCGVLGYVSAGG